MFLNGAAVLHSLVSPFFFFLHLQYLKDEDEDLVSPPNTKGNQWLKFLQESTHLKGEL